MAFGPQYAVSPPGWSDVVEKMKENSSIDNPFALAWSLYDRGAEPHQCAGKDCKHCEAAVADYESSGAKDVYSRRYGAMAAASIDAAEWTSAYINELPDSAFAVVETGGEKDADGRTTPRTLRHLPYRDKDGKVDFPHLRNALSRLSQTDLSPELKRRAAKVLRRAAKDAGIGEQDAEALLRRDACDVDHTEWLDASKDVPPCQFCGSKDTGLQPPDFETVKCATCGKNFQLEASNTSRHPAGHPEAGRFATTAAGALYALGLWPGEKRHVEGTRSAHEWAQWAAKLDQAGFMRADVGGIGTTSTGPGDVIQAEFVHPTGARVRASLKTAEKPEECFCTIHGTHARFEDAGADHIGPGAIYSALAGGYDIAAARMVLADGDTGLQPGEKHPNKTPFKAILHNDKPSTRAPNGASGHGPDGKTKCPLCPHRVIIPDDVTDRRIGSLVGMGIDSTLNLDGHNAKKKIGVITAAKRGVDPDPNNPMKVGPIAPGDAVIAGHLYEKDFPDEVADLRRSSKRGELGGSYEISKVKLRNNEYDPIWTLDDFVYTGAAALKKHDAAYQDSAMAASSATTEASDDEIRHALTLAAAGRPILSQDDKPIPEEEDDMTKEELKAALEECMSPIVTRLEKLEKQEEEQQKASKKKDDEAAAKKSEEEASKRTAEENARKEDEEGRKKEEAARVKREEARGKKEEAKAVRAKHGKREDEEDEEAKHHEEDARKADEDAKKLDEEAAGHRFKAKGLRAQAAGADPVTINAMAELATDQTQQIKTLLTDTVSTMRGLVTDVKRGPASGGEIPMPARRGLDAAAMEHSRQAFLSKYPEAGAELGKGGRLTETQLTSILRTAGKSPRDQIACINAAASLGFLRPE